MAASRWVQWVAPSPKPVDLKPYFPIEPFTPNVGCSHRGPIRDDSSFCCMACNKASRLNERIIDTSPATPVVDPEYRIAHLHRMEQDGMLTPIEIEAARETIRRIEDLIDPGRQPTRYTPTPGLKGGLG